MLGLDRTTVLFTHTATIQRIQPVIENSYHSIPGITRFTVRIDIRPRYLSQIRREKE